MPRIVSYTIQPVTANDITSVTFRLVGGVVAQVSTYELKDETSRVVASGTITQTLTAGQRAAFANFLTNNTVTDINTQENL